MIQDFPIDQNDSRQYLQMLQDTINRMAKNSSNCKAWMITIFTAMAALLVGVPEIRQWIGIIVIPAILFWFLDGFYLGLEKDFRNLEQDYVAKLHSNEDCTSYIYNFNYKSAEGYEKHANLKDGLSSIATWPLYLAITVISVVLCIIFHFVKPEQQEIQDIETPLKQLVIKQDSMVKTIDEFKEKIKPIKIESKSFHNSSFFQADNIDSVNVNLYKGKVRE